MTAQSIVFAAQGLAWCGGLRPAHVSPRCLSGVALAFCASALLQSSLARLLSSLLNLLFATGFAIRVREACATAPCGAAAGAARQAEASDRDRPLAPRAYPRSSASHRGGPALASPAVARAGASVRPARRQLTRLRRARGRDATAAQCRGAAAVVRRQLRRRHADGSLPPDVWERQICNVSSQIGTFEKRSKYIEDARSFEESLTQNGPPTEEGGHIGQARPQINGRGRDHVRNEPDK